MILCSINATFKIYGKNKIIQDDQIAVFLSNYFSNESVIDIHTLIKWCGKVKELTAFMICIDKIPPESKYKKIT